MKLSKKIAVVTAMTAVTVVGNIAASTPASALTKGSKCAPKMVQAITVTDTTATAIFKIAEGCPTQTVSLSVYKKPAETYPLSNQRNHSYATNVYGPGTHTIQTSMPEKDCFYQVDLFMGGPNVVLTKPTYSDVLLGYKLGGSKDCLAEPPVQPDPDPEPIPEEPTPEEPTPVEPSTPPAAPAPKGEVAPAALPETGVSSIGAIAATVTGVSALGHRLVTRRLSR